MHIKNLLTCHDAQTDWVYGFCEFYLASKTLNELRIVGSLDTAHKLRK